VKFGVQAAFYKLKKIRKILLVGAPRFELGTSCAQASGVNRLGLQTLNALFGVAYDREHLNPDPQLGNFWETMWVKKSAEK
jgi:hypothetical protein